MGRILNTLLLLIVCISISISQCPDLPNNTTVNGSTATTIEMCGAMPALFEVNDPDLPSGTIDWFSSTTSGFDPLSSGTLIGSSAISSADPCAPGGCPTIEVIYIDACGPGPEAYNEFMVLGSGSGFAVDDLSVTFDVNNTFGSVGNGNINIGGVCGWQAGDLSLFSGCGSLISVGPGDYIPPNSAVIIQTSILGTTVYDVSSMCGVSDCIYVLSNSCDRNVGAFSNCGGGTAGGSTRNNEINLTCGCNDVLVYDILDPSFLNICNTINGNGMHVFSDLTYANNVCDAGPNLGSIPQYIYSAVTDDFNHTFTNADCNTTQYIVGVLNSSQYNVDCCSQQITDEYAFDIACITAELQGMADLCPGECEEISVLIDGGTAPYNLDLSITGLPFPFDNITLPFIGFPLDGKITICFDNGGPLVDPSTFTVDVPSVAGGFSGSLVLNSITDDTGCAGTIQGSTISLNFNNAPTIVNPGDQEACDIGNGTGIFVLSDLTTIINNGTAANVNFFSDMAGTMPIVSPYITSGGPVYAQVDGSPCSSEIIEIQLIVISNGDAGLVTFFCTDPNDGPSSDCTICDDDGVLGEEVSLTIIFEDATANYDYEVVWTAASGPSSTIMGSGIGTATVMFPIVETTTFAISVVTEAGGCPDMTDLGDIITMNYSIQPDILAPQNLSDCGSVTLPDITGDDVPANAAYFSQSGGMGTMYNSGDMISTTTTLFLYAGIEDCDIEYSFDITIEEPAMIDDPDDVITCGGYSLPPITGTNIDNASYFTAIDGGGNMVSEGTIISTSTILFLYDPNCGGNQPTLDITITPGPAITNNTDTIVCEMYIVEPITGIDLSGNEMYYDTTDGLGLIINVGDTLTQDSILFIYDNTGGCEVEIPVFIDIQYTAYPGLDTAIVLCEGDPTLININETLGGDLPDSTGVWLDVGMTGIISDSSQVDFSTLSSGLYLFEYQILDSICIDTHSVLTVNIIGSPNAGTDASISICSDTTGVDIFNLLGNPDMSGTFFDEAGIPTTFDLSDASFSAAIPGTATYSYVVGNPFSSCGADTSIFSVIIEGSVAAGDNTTTGVCAGTVINLDSLLTNNSGIGVYEELTISGGLSGNTFDTDNLDDGTYLVFHILPGIGTCPADTATLTIIVRDGANAGDENTIELCGDTLVSLSEYINGDAGGMYYFNNTLLPSGDISFTSEIGMFDYLYIVGDGIECPFDTAILTVVRNIQPPSFLDISLENLCTDDCTTVTFNVANSGAQMIEAFYHIESNSGEVDNRVEIIGDLMPDVETTFCIGIGDLSNNVLQPGTEYTFTLDSIYVDLPNCIYIVDSSVVFNTYTAAFFELTGNYCIADSIPVGMDIYHANNTQGTTIIPNGSVNGCDSIVQVDLTFSDFAEGDFMRTACVGDTIPVIDTFYTETNTTDEYVIPNGSVNGCDSLVKINIVFFESTTFDYSETICAGGSTIINGEEFHEGNLSNIQVLSGANAMGCDSLVDVTIEVEEPVTFTHDGDYCPSYFIEINGETYDISNPTGTEPFANQAANGCDSIVIIDLTFNQPAIDSIFTNSTCDNEYSVVIGGITFDSSHTSEIVTIPSNSPNACDTIVDVNLIFGELLVQYVEMDGGCEVTDSGSVIITSISGVAPFNILYNGNNTPEFGLPIVLNLPIGTGELSITDDEGCEAIVNYELFSGGGEAFFIDENQGQITVTGGTVDSISWSPIDGLSCIDCLDPIANPSQSTTYTASIFFDDSCSVDLSIDINVIDNTPDYILPNVISPNGDNVNENFILTITEGAVGIPQSMLIYDRWGNRVFTGFGEGLLNEGWNGTHGGKDVVPGVYVYQITVLEGEKIVSIYGDVTVVR